MSRHRVSHALQVRHRKCRRQRSGLQLQDHPARLDLVAAQQEVALLVASQRRVDYPYKAPERLALRVGKIGLDGGGGGRQAQRRSSSSRIFRFGPSMPIGAGARRIRPARLERVSLWFSLSLLRILDAPLRGKGLVRFRGGEPWGPVRRCLCVPNSASPPSTASISRPCAVVVSAHVSPRERCLLHFHCVSAATRRMNMNVLKGLMSTGNLH
jgi:hypothetical protein